MKKNNVFIGLIIVFIVIVAVLIGSNGAREKAGKLIPIRYNELLEKMDNKDSFILLVSQSTCSHCASYKPKLTEIAKDHSVDIYYIDYDMENKDIQKEFLEKFNLSGATPITMFIENGKEKSLLNRLEGDLSSTRVLDQFEKMGFIEK